MLVCVRAVSTVDRSPPEAARGQVAGTRENGDRLLLTEVVHPGAGPGLGARAGGAHPGAGFEPASLSGGDGGPDAIRPVVPAGSGGDSGPDDTRPAVPAGCPLDAPLGPGSQTAGGGGQA